MDHILMLTMFLKQIKQNKSDRMENFVQMKWAELKSKNYQRK